MSHLATPGSQFVKIYSNGLSDTTQVKPWDQVNDRHDLLLFSMLLLRGLIRTQLLITSIAGLLSRFERTVRGTALDMRLRCSVSLSTGRTVSSSFGRF